MENVLSLNPSLRRRENMSSPLFKSLPRTGYGGRLRVPILAVIRDSDEVGRIFLDSPLKAENDK
jgi:hypothetical protein